MTKAKDKYIFSNNVKKYAHNVEGRRSFHLKEVVA
jgi:hypothetical protein